MNILFQRMGENVKKHHTIPTWVFFLLANVTCKKYSVNKFPRNITNFNVLALMLSPHVRVSLSKEVLTKKSERLITS